MGLSKNLKQIISSGKEFIYQNERANKIIINFISKWY